VRITSVYHKIILSDSVHRQAQNGIPILDHVPSAPSDVFLRPYFDDLDEERWLAADVVQTRPTALHFHIDSPDQWPLILNQRMQRQFRVLALGRLYAAQACLDPRVPAAREEGYVPTTLPGSQLATQLFVLENDAFRPEVEPIRNHPKMLRKPRTGFWTSSYDSQYGSNWVRWCFAHRRDFTTAESHWVVLTVSPSARIAAIDSPSDLVAWMERYPRQRGRGRGIRL
jgi:hypothetical protein